jgi:hypothetical protein
MSLTGLFGASKKWRDSVNKDDFTTQLVLLGFRLVSNPFFTTPSPAEIYVWYPPYPIDLIKVQVHPGMVAVSLNGCTEMFPTDDLASATKDIISLMEKVNEQLKRK